MAIVATVKNVTRPIIPAASASGLVSVADEDADFLVVSLDRYGDGRMMGSLTLAFADHAGLEAEWIAGVATTVLQAALDSVVPAIVWPTDELTAVQRGVVGYEVSVA